MTTPQMVHGRTPATRPGHRLSTTLLGLTLPLALVGAAVSAALGWRDELPDPVAMHWGTSGPDGFGSLTTVLVTPVVLTAVLAVAAWLLGILAGHSATTRRLGNGTSAGLAALLGTVVLTTLDGQRGLADATLAPDADSSVALALAAGLVIGGLVAFLTPGDEPRPTHDPVPVTAARLPVTQDERAVWFATASSGPTLAVGGLAVLLTAVTAVATQMWWMLAVPVLLTVLLLSMSRWAVRVDAAGLEVRSTLGLPRTSVPLDEVVLAEVTSVRPLRDFGGWGWRTAVDGRVGVVLRAGEALSVVRTGGRVLVVTVDDAATAAALLNSLAARGRGAAGDV